MVTQLLHWQTAPIMYHARHAVVPCAFAKAEPTPTPVRRPFGLLLFSVKTLVLVELQPKLVVMSK